MNNKTQEAFKMAIEKAMIPNTKAMQQSQSNPVFLAQGSKLVAGHEGVFVEDKNLKEKELAPTAWKKHDGSQVCPEDEWSVIEVETYTASSFTAFAKDLEWEHVVFYRVIEDTGETI